MSVLNCQLKNKIVQSKKKFYDITLRSFPFSPPEKLWQHAAPKFQSDLSPFITADAFNAYFQLVFTEDDAVILPFVDSFKSGIGNITITE